MHSDLVWLTAALLSFPLITVCDPLNVMSAPNLLRVGSTEKVFVEAQDYSGEDLNVRIIVKSHPQKNIELATSSVVLNNNNQFQALVDIKIPDNMNYFSDDPLEKQYVYLQAVFPSSTLEKVVMVSFQSGYIFVQTDKTIYTPKSEVRFRVFSVTPDLRPRDQSRIFVEIINPQEITIHRDTIYPKQGVQTGIYKIPELASPGIWSLSTKYMNNPQKKFTVQFEVREYVLPTFEVSIKPSKSFFYVDDPNLQVEITATYLFGRKVDGSAFVVFGVIDGESKTSIAASLQRVSINEGEGLAILTREMIQKTYPDIKQLVGKSLYISVSVLTETGSEMVEAERRGIQIVTSPYTIHFMRTPKFFKPGMPFDVTVYVTNPDQTPAENVDIEVQPGGVRSRTKQNGMVKVTVNTRQNERTLRLSAETNVQGILKERQAKNEMTAEAYAPKGNSQNYLHIGIDSAELEIGDQMKIYLNFWSPGVQNQDFTYMILSKGQIVYASKFKRQGQSVMTVSLPVTKDMVPSIRVVAYYHVGSEVVADSVWVDVKDTCMGKLEVKVKDRRNYEPGDEYELLITGDPDAKVGLIAVDKGTFVLNNKNRLTQTKIWDIIEQHDTGCTAGSGKDSMGVFYDAGLLFESDKLGGTDTRTSSYCPTPPKRRKRAATLRQASSIKVSGIKRMKRDDLEIEFDEIVSRTLFPESWLFSEQILPPCPGNGQWYY